ncbi:MAG: glycerol-3-phosphate 1-O-acyltransferase PlsY [Piscirickettsiaceae bacterium]|nr:glycerol-3-phosphate 1-O-acyltransferase PlsY [Piscirickettsiaceae bacterium]
MLENFALLPIVLISAYLIGSLSSAILLCELMGLPDPRSKGSRNPGATNVLRFGGKKLAFIVLIIDVFKGALPVIITCFLGFDQTWMAATAFLAFLGHLYPLFFEFQGGKGVATALGGFLAISPLMAILVLSTWVIVCLISRTSWLSAITAAVMSPMYSLWLIDNIHARWIVFIMSIMLLFRHRNNMKLLMFD